MNGKILTLSVLILVGVFFVIFIGTGQYDISADTKHWKVTESVLAVVRDRSIESRAADIEVPTGLDDDAIIVGGAGNYDTMCSTCHLKPGKKESELFIGLYPQPPNFSELKDHARQDHLKETFWIIKHGLKMTGMPAWGKSHSDKDIWAMVAFLQKLPKLNSVDYAAMVKQSGGHNHSDGNVLDHQSSESGNGHHDELGGKDDSHSHESKPHVH